MNDSSVEFTSEAETVSTVSVEQMLHDDGETVLVRQSGQTGNSRLLRSTRARPPLATRQRLQHEFGLRDRLRRSWAAVPLELDSTAERPVLKTTDPGGVLLEQEIGRAWEVEPFLRISVGIAEAIRRTHDARLVHKDIRPAHIFVDVSSCHAWLCGFASAAAPEQNTTGPREQGTSAVTLTHASPEISGRMDRCADARSDLYSFGVVLYQMLTGRLPFLATDARELVHAHLAKPPVPPSQYATAVPPMLDLIVLKLLAKSAEDRYQTAAGIETDLRLCLHGWQARQAIEPFAMESSEVVGRLRIPEQLYGRDQEVEALRTAFTQVESLGRLKVVLVAGFSGIGKSAIVAEFQRSLPGGGSRFASGKAEQYQSSVPHGTLGQALQGLLRPLLVLPDAEQDAWRQQLQEAVITNGRIIANMAPELEELLGTQPALPELSPREHQIQFQTTLGRFLKVFINARMPLVLFLDDLQWVDGATLDSIDHLLGAEPTMNLLLIGAYRSNEVQAGHLLDQWLAGLRARSADVDEIILAPLLAGEIANLVSDALACSPEACVELSQLVYRTTSGNPFFATQFITGLADEGLLYRQTGTNAWGWDMEHLRRHAHRDDVLELMVKRISKLASTTQHILKNLACLGISSSAPTLTHVCGVTDEELHIALWPAVGAGFCLRLPLGYRFLHDRVQEAAYALIPQDQRAASHLAIARLLLVLTGDATQSGREASEFDLVGQFNLGAGALQSQDERDRVADLNLTAAQRALTATAHAAARGFAIAGINLLGPEGQSRQERLSFQLDLVCAESDFLAGHPDPAERALRKLLERASTPLDNAAICRRLVELYVVGSRYGAAVDQALVCLRLFDVDIAAHPSREAVAESFAEVMDRLGERSIESLVDLPLAIDPAVAAAMNVLGEIFAAAYFTDSALVVLHLCRMVRLTLEKGLTPASAHGFAWFGVMIGQHFGRYREGLRFAELACALVDKHGFAASEAKTLFALEIASVWAKPLTAAIAASRNAFSAGSDRGDIAVACFACNHTVNDMLVRGDHLDDVAREIDSGLGFVRRARYLDVVDELVTQERFVAALRGNAPLAAVFDGAGFEESTFETQFTEDRMPTMIFWYWVLKGQLCFLAGRVDDSRDALRHATGWLSSAVHIQLLNYHLYSALAAAAGATVLPASAAADRRAQIIEHLTLLRRWRDCTPETFADKTELVEAELARCEGRSLDAEVHFEEALRLARLNGCAWVEALANELAARFHAARGVTTIAQTYLRQARYAYLRWGASAKVHLLDLEHAWLVEDATLVATSRTRSVVELLDVDTVVKVSEAIASEIDSDRLIETLLKVALEHAGAERGLLFLPTENGMELEAQAQIHGDEIQVMRRSALPADVSLPTSVLHLVQQSAQQVLLDDASRSTAHAGDPYFVSRRSRSVLCLPLLKQARLAGILYLENDLMAGAFTSKRIAVLRLVASQAAIALENARLYRELTRENRDRRLAEESNDRTSLALRESESRFRRMADATPDVIWITDTVPERVLYASPSFERIWGRSVNALYLNPQLWIDGIHPDDRGKVQAAFASWLGSDGALTWDMEFRVVQPGGAIRWIHERGAFLHEGDGSPRRISGISTDVTEQRVAVLALQESEERFALATVGSNDGIWDWDLTTNQMFLSQRAQELYGLKAGAMRRLRHEWVALIALHPEDVMSQRQMIADYLDGKRPSYDGEWRVIHPDGIYRWVRIRGVCLRDDNGQPTRLAGSVSDVDARRRAEAAVQQMQRLEAVGTLAGGVAHDFNNILAAILGFGEASLRHTRPGSRMRRDLECILSAGERGRALVERILAFSRSSVGERIAVDVESVIAESLTMIEAMRPAQVQIETQLSAGQSAMMGDPTQVHQVLMNLATNAMQAMPNGGTLQIQLYCEVLDEERMATTGLLAAGEYVVLSIRDTGAGIDPTVRERIFDPFFTTKDVGTGTGLGLSLVHGIVTELGGAIDVATEVNVGSCFTAYLPRSGEIGKRREERPSPLPRGQNERVLVVDDEEPLVRLTSDMLKELGYLTVAFTSGSDALDAFRAHPELFDAVVTDARMPRMSGLALIRALRELKSTVPILLVSGFLGGAAATEAREAGADATLSKPLSRRDLAGALAQALRANAAKPPSLQ